MIRSERFDALEQAGFKVDRQGDFIVSFGFSNEDSAESSLNRKCF